MSFIMMLLFLLSSFPCRLSLVISLTFLFVVMGSMEHTLSSLSVYGSVKADGESSGKISRWLDYASTTGGPGGGSGGTVLLFLHMLTVSEESVISSVGGLGSLSGGGGGGGGRIHFHWSDIPTGDEYYSIASVAGNITSRFGLNFLVFRLCVFLCYVPMPKELHKIYLVF